MEDDISQNFLEIFTIVWLNDILSYLKYKDQEHDAPCLSCLVTVARICPLRQTRDMQIQS